MSTPSKLSEAIDTIEAETRNFYTAKPDDDWCNLCDTTEGHADSCPISVVFAALSAKDERIKTLEAALELKDKEIGRLRNEVNQAGVSMMLVRDCAFGTKLCEQCKFHLAFGIRRAAAALKGEG